MNAVYVKSVVTGLIFAILAYIYNRTNFCDNSDSPVEIEQYVISSWKNDFRAPANQFKKLAVGINSNVDYIVPGIDLMEKLGISPGKMKNHEILSSLSDFQETFSFFFNKGSAAERVYSDPALFKQIIEAVESLDEIEQYTGGNAALMALKMAHLFPHAEILFIGPVGPQLRELMPEVIQIPASSHIAADEIHLIMEYQVGDKWGDIRAPVANRFISSYDESNTHLTMLDKFFEGISKFHPDLVLVSGIHLLDVQPQHFYESKIKSLAVHLESIPSNIPVHLELASMANTDFVHQVVHKLFPKVDSLGLNEQELFISSTACDGPHAHEFNEHGQPVIDKVSDIILWLLKTFGYSQKNPTSKLTRIHFHSLTYHIIGTIGNIWGNSESAVAAGAAIAGQQACDVEELSADIVDIKIPLRYKLFTGDEERDFNGSEPVTSYNIEGCHFVFSPVLVCKKPLKTVGLGDAISAAGLMYSEFNRTNS